jgi:hypothetical protein
MRSLVRRGLLTLTLVLVLSGAAQPAGVRARREETFGYPFSRVWTTAVRLMRVDLECPITEKDKDEGYFFFNYPDADSGKTYPGSVEMVTGKDGGSENVRVVITVAAMPSYVEAMMLDKLERKLREDFGEPKGGPGDPGTKPDGNKPDGNKPDGTKPDGSGSNPGSGSAPKPAAPKPAPAKPQG